MTAGQAAESAELVAIARLGRPRGVQGECHAVALGPTLGGLELPCSVQVGRDAGQTAALVLIEARQQGDGWVCRFEGVAEPNGAGGLRNLYVFAATSQLPQLAGGQLYEFELVGMEVRASGRPQAIGRVSAVHDYPTMDAVEVVIPGGRTVVIPLSPGVVQSVDRAQRIIEVAGELLDEIL